MNTNDQLMNDPLIESIVNCMAVVKEVSPEIFDAITNKLNAKENEKNQLLQEDQNLADEQTAIERQINDCETEIAEHEVNIQTAKRCIKSLNGTRGNLIKKLNNLKTTREEVWKKWNAQTNQPLTFDLNTILGGIANAH